MTFVKYRLANSVCKTWLQLPPLSTYGCRESRLTSAAVPVVEAFLTTEFTIIKGWPGSWVSERPSCPTGIKLKVDWPAFGGGNFCFVIFGGRLRSAWRMIYWWGGQALGASLYTYIYISFKLETHEANFLEPREQNYEPLKPAINKCRGESAIIAIQHHIDRCKSSKCRQFRVVIGNLVRDNATPERIKCCGSEYGTATLGIDDPIIKRKLWWIPK